MDGTQNPHFLSALDLYLYLILKIILILIVLGALAFVYFLRFHWFRIPWVSAVGTIAAVLAGVLASISTVAIRNSIFLPDAPTNDWPMLWDNFKFTWPGVFFWALVAIALVVFIGVKSSDQAETKKNHDEMSDMLDEYRSLPHRNFLIRYNKSFENAHRAFVLTFTSALQGSDTDFPARIREVLATIVDMVREFEICGDERISTNIMLYDDGWTSEKAEKVAQYLGSDHLKPNLYAGILDVKKDLSWTAKADENKIDGSLSEFALPVVKTQIAADGDKKNLIPGAPDAYHTGLPVRFGSIEELLDWVEKYHVDHITLGPSIKNYFENAGKDIKSFVSIPIPAVIAEEADGSASKNIVAILNIHASYKEIFILGYELFLPLVSPKILLLSEMLKLYNEDQKKTVKTKT